MRDSLKNDKGVETDQNVRDRAQRVVDHIKARHKEEENAQIAMVAHSFFFQGMLNGTHLSNC